MDFVNLEKKGVVELDGGQHALDLTPHPDPLPQGERGDHF